MQILRVLSNGELQSAAVSASVAVLGNLDGVHRGHQRLLAEARSIADKRSVPLLTVSFYPHPAVVLGRTSELPMITSLRQKVRVLDALGVDRIALVRFTSALSQLSAEDFVGKVLLGMLNIETLVVGPDAAVGRGRTGTASVLAEIFERAGRACTTLPFLELEGERVSSRRIRSVVAAGDLATARALLGRGFALDGRVQHGAKRGQGIGFPTLNLAVNGRVLPPRGVYATRTQIGACRYPSVTNLGVRPTFAGTTLSAETHLLDYAGPALYGNVIEVEFVEHIREERRFPSVQELRHQIGRDVEEARKLL